MVLTQNHSTNLAKIKEIAKLNTDTQEKLDGWYADYLRSRDNKAAVRVIDIIFDIPAETIFPSLED